MIYNQINNNTNYTKQDKKIIQYLKEHPKEMSALTCIQLSNQISVSHSAIIRFIQKLGFKSFKQFQIQLNNEYLNQQNTQIKTTEPITEKSYYDQITETIQTLKNTVCFDVIENFSQNQMIKIANQLKQADIIDIYGIGVDYHIASLQQYKLNCIGYNCICHSGLNENYILHHSKSTKRIAILISISGKNHIINEIAKQLKLQQIPTILITVTQNKHNHYLFNEVIVCKSNFKYVGLDMFSFIEAIETCFDILFALMLQRNLEKTKAAALQVSYYNKK